MRRLKLKYVPIIELRVDPANREWFDPLKQEELNELAASIKEKGLINPITITPDYLIIAGEQRYTAARQAELEEVPVIIREPKDNLDLEEIRHHENIFRRSLPPYRSGRIFKRLAEIKRLRAEQEAAGAERQLSDFEIDREIAKETGLERRTVHDKRQLANLIPQFGEMLDATPPRINRDLARELAKLSPDLQLMYYNTIRTEDQIKLEASEARQLRIKLQEVETSKREADEARKSAEDAAAQWRSVVEQRDAEIDAKVKKLVDIRVAEARREAKKAKQEAERAKRAERDAKQRAAEILKEQKKQYAKEVQAVKKTVTYKFILSHCEPLRKQDAREVADKVPLHPELSIAILEGAEQFIPWLENFANRLRARCAEQGYTGRGSRSALKEVR
jgi:ParB family transcriptional regulator, chromosome partitioning protein